MLLGIISDTHDQLENKNPVLNENRVDDIPR